MGRKIILLSDGTGNSSAKVWRTNVWRVFESLDLSGSSQVAFYDDGVGTSSFKPGGDSRRRVRFWPETQRHRSLQIRLSQLAQRRRRNLRLRFQPRRLHDAGGDGAYFRPRSRQSDYQIRTWTARRRLPIATFAGGISTPSGASPRRSRVGCAILVVGIEYSRDDNFQGAKIRFLGLWDTVAAYGMPVEEMTRGISQWLFPLLASRLQARQASRACLSCAVDRR